MGCTGHLYHAVRMTDGGVGPPIPCGPHDGWGVSQDPSVSVIRPRIGPLWRFTRVTHTGLVVELEHLKIKTRLTNEKFGSVKGECELSEGECEI